MATHRDGDSTIESGENREPGRDVEEAETGNTTEEQKNTWYELPAGKAIIVSGIFITVFAVAASLESTGLIAENASIPFVVYLYGFFGAMARSLLFFVTDVDPDTDDSVFVERSWILVVRLGLRLFGALCLAAGIYLAQSALDNALIFALAPPEAIFAGLAFLAGFYVDRTYSALGFVAKRLLDFAEQSSTRSQTETGDVSSLSLNMLSVAQRPDEPRWYSDARSIGLFALGLALLSIGIIASFGTNVIPLVPPIANPVPPYVYLYALLGSLGYLFTTLFREFDRSLISIVQNGIRVPVALLLAAGFYMFTFLFITSDSSATGLISGLSFLVGLYVNVALVTLDKIASRVFSRLGDEST